MHAFELFHSKQGNKAKKMQGVTELKNMRKRKKELMDQKCKITKIKKKYDNV